MNDKTVTWQQACDAVEDLDDYARMTVGVDPIGPRETLYRFIEQQKNEIERVRVERVVLTELTLKTGELIEHLQNTGRLKPCFYMPALADARNALEAKRG